MLDWVSTSPLLIVGVLLDVMGVGILLVPNVPPVARQFRFGRLQVAQKVLEQGELTAEDTGFVEIVQLFDRSIEPEHIAPDDVERIKLEPEATGSTEESATIAYRFLFEYADHVGEPVSSYFVPPNPIYPEFRRTIDRDKGLFRVAGLAYIAFGLLLQFGAITAG